MSTIGELVDYLHEIAPNHYQEDYDNSGLLVGSMSDEVQGVLVSLDCTEAVVQEAIDLGCNVIVSHHPIVFKGLKRFNGNNYVERTVIKAIKNNIALFAIHTNLDNVFQNGVNQRIAEQLDLCNLRILSPKFEASTPIGAGMIGDFVLDLDELDFLAYVKEKMKLHTIKHTKLLGRKVKKVAICGGSGSFLLQEAIKNGADAYISSDFKYHEFFDAEDKIMIMDIGHYESERYTIDLLYALISNKFTNFASHCTKVETNPIQYY